MTNAVSWFELPAVDFSRAIKFYSTVLGTAITPNETMGVPLGMFPYVQGLGVGGAIISLQDEHLHTGAERPIVYLYVGKTLEPALERGIAAGAEVIMSRTEIGEFGAIAVIRDTEGNHVGLHSDA